MTGARHHRFAWAVVVAALVLPVAAMPGRAQDADAADVEAQARARAEAERTRPMAPAARTDGPAADQAGKKKKAKAAKDAPAGAQPVATAARKAAGQRAAGQDAVAPEAAGPEAADGAESLTNRAELIGGVLLGALDQTRESPLFTPGREPPKPPPPPKKKVQKAAPPPPPPPPPQPPSLRLVGVVMTGESTLALMLGKDRSVTRVALGDEIDGWSVVKLEAETVELALKDRRSVYRMFKPQPGDAEFPLGDEPDDRRNKRKRQKAG